jgi:hypothetical protein
LIFGSRLTIRRFQSLPWWALIFLSRFKESGKTEPARQPEPC